MILRIDQKTRRHIGDVLCLRRLVDRLAAADEEPATLGWRRRTSVGDDDVERLVPDVKG